MRSGARILLVDDDRGLLRTLQVLLEDEGGYVVETATSGGQALELLLATSTIRLVISDLSMPGMDGLELLRELRQQRPELPVILVTAFGTVRSAVDAMRHGAFQYLTKPVDPDELLLQVARALEHARISREHRLLNERAGDPEQFDVLVGESRAIADLRATIERVAAVDSTLLLRGETGTGKELVARLVHKASPRRDGPFVAINCTAIPGELLESELFGHEKGAFTGAGSARPGRIEEAAGGTLLLDEIGDMPLALQPKMLRFLQDRTVRRIGSSRERVIDLRVVAATHRDLESAIEKEVFRRDLFYRIGAVPVAIPPLREHPEDLPELCRHLIAKISRRIGRPVVGVADDALEVFRRYGFPGNVRELENLLEHAIVLGRSWKGSEEEITAADLSPQVIEPRDPVLVDLPLDGGMSRLAELQERMERRLISRAVEQLSHLSNEQIAVKLGTNRRVLELRMKQYGIVKPARGPSTESR